MCAAARQTPCTYLHCPFTTALVSVGTARPVCDAADASCRDTALTMPVAAARIFLPATGYGMNLPSG